MQHFLQIFLHYCRELLPALAAGFLISGLVHEFIPENAVVKYLGGSGIKPIFWSTLIGALLPVCCWGSLPIAVSFSKKGARLGPVLAFLIATPATSVSALFVSYSVLGGLFTAYIFFAVIAMGLVMGVIGNSIKYTPAKNPGKVPCSHCESDPGHAHEHKKKTFPQKIASALKYAYVVLPKEIGLELVVGIFLAAFVAVFLPVGKLIKLYLGGILGYVFAVVFGLVMYLCSTASVPLIDSLMSQGMNPGAAMTLLLIGPVTSYGTILVLKKEYGMKVLSIFIISITMMTTLLGIGFQCLKLAAGSYGWPL